MNNISYLLPGKSLLFPVRISFIEFSRPPTMAWFSFLSLEVKAPKLQTMLYCGEW